MQKVLHLRTTVQLGGKVEIDRPELWAGQTLEMVVLHETSVRGRVQMNGETS